MAETDIEKLIVELQANAAGLNKALTQIARDVDGRLKRIEQRTEAMNRRVSSSMTRAGNAMNRVGAVLFGGAVIAGITRFVSTISRAAGEIVDTSEALGIGTDALQAWGIQAAQTGVSQEQLNSALEKLSKNVGEAKQGSTKFGEMMKKLGVDTSTVESTFLGISDNMAKLGDQSEKSALAVLGFGKAGIAMVPMVQQGSATINENTEALKKNAAIISEENLKAIDQMGDRWEVLKKKFTAIGANVLAGFSDEFNQFADQLESEEFQTAMRQFGQFMAQLAKFSQMFASLLPNVISVWAALRGVALVLGQIHPLARIAIAITAFVAPELFQTEEVLQKIKRLHEEIIELESRKVPVLASTDTSEFTKKNVIAILDKQIAERRAEINRLESDIPLPEVKVTPRVGGGTGTLPGTTDDKDQALIDESTADLLAAQDEVVQANAEANLAIERNVEKRYALERDLIQLNTQHAIRAAEVQKNLEISKQEELLKKKEISQTAFDIFKENRELQFDALVRSLNAKQEGEIIQSYDNEADAAEELKRKLADIRADIVDDAARARRDAAAAATELTVEQSIGTPEEFGTKFDARSDQIDRDEQADIEASDRRLARQLEDMAREAERLQLQGDDYQKYLDNRVIAEEAAAAEISAIRDRASADRIQNERDLLTAQLQATSDFFGELATLSSSGNATLAAIGKAAAITQATIDGILAVQKALASAPPPFNFALAAAVGVATAVNVAKIAGMDKGGVVGSEGVVPLKRYTRGGVASKPQMALFGEGDLNEAYIPLQDGHRVPVALDEDEDKAFVPLPGGRRIPVLLKRFARGGIAGTQTMFAGQSTLPDGQSIPQSLNTPNIPQGMGNAQQSFSQQISVDARGAQQGVGAEIEARMRAIAPAIAATSVAIVTKRLPDMMRKANSRKL